jgi:beta-1,4-mannosyltransferase
MSKIYLYPKPDKLVVSPNPYIKNFEAAILKNHDLVNEKAINRGVLSLFLFFVPTEIFIFNWVEFIPEKRFGKLQSLCLVFLILMARLFGKKIIWILHNKNSHHKSKNIWTDSLFQLMMMFSHKIITHSNAGLDLVKSSFPKYTHKVEVITHPVTAMFDLAPAKEKAYDFIIWGSIYPYKGIDRFLEFLKESPYSAKYKVLLVGKCFDEKYKEKIEDLLTDNVVFYDQMFDLEMIAEFSNQSKFTLFTYKSDTVISSGSLIDSIRMGSVIIGPNHAAFKDLSSYSFVKTYDSFEEIFAIHDSYVPLSDLEQKERLNFVKANSWDKFIEKLEVIIHE